jgi:hypothetical protein
MEFTGHALLVRADGSEGLRLGTVRLGGGERAANLCIIIFELDAGGLLLCAKREETGFIGAGAVQTPSGAFSHSKTTPRKGGLYMSSQRRGDAESRLRKLTSKLRLAHVITIRNRMATVCSCAVRFWRRALLPWCSFRTSSLVQSQSIVSTSARSIRRSPLTSFPLFSRRLVSLALCLALLLLIAQRLWNIEVTRRPCLTV